VERINRTLCKYPASPGTWTKDGTAVAILSHLLPSDETVMFDKPAVPPPNVEAPHGPERRKHIRYTPSSATCVHLVTAANDVLFPDRINNISAGGISLVLDREIKPGTIATIDLFNITREFPCQLELCVTYALGQEDGSVVHGCSFKRALDNVEVWGLL
jgi:hypothetical protein